MQHRALPAAKNAGARTTASAPQAVNASPWLCLPTASLEHLSLEAACLWESISMGGRSRTICVEEWVGGSL